MSAWNYRVIRSSHGGYVIKDVYYDGGDDGEIDDGDITGWSAEPAHPYGETEKELHQDLEFMMKAFEAPVLDEEELQRRHQ